MIDAASLSLDQFEDFRIARAKRTEMAGLRKTADANVIELEAAVYAASSDAETDRVETAARALFAGGIDSFPPLDPGLLTRLDAARERLRVAKRAEGIAQQALAKVREARSLEICQRLQPAHRRRVRRIAAAFVHLSNLCTERTPGLDEACAGGVQIDATSLPNMTPSTLQIGDWRAQGSPVHTWLATAKRLGFIGPGEDPSKLVEED